MHRTDTSASEWDMRSEWQRVNLELSGAQRDVDAAMRKLEQARERMVAVRRKHAHWLRTDA